jgi:hypothetical protein
MFDKFYSHWRFTFLLGAALFIIGTRLAMSESAANEVALDLFGVLLLVIGLVTLCEDRRHRMAALILGCPAILLELVAHAFPLEIAGPVQLTWRVSALFFLLFTVGTLVRAVITARTVTWDTISAALVGYLFIGIIWTQVFCALELARPGSFAVSGSSAGQLDDPRQRQVILEYFSFSTLSTLGYGDIVPVSRPARSLACLEAICGQLYLAVLVAGLVGMRGARSPSPSDGPSE